MVSKVERFWIAFILRFAIGFLFLFAALNIFNYGPDKFSADLSKGFQNTWLANLELGPKTGLDIVTYFLHGMPYVLAGLFLRPALRLGALLLVMLGLGKYLQNDVMTTAADFLFALIICIGLYFLSLDRYSTARREELPA
jgi:hypothetical protein